MNIEKLLMEKVLQDTEQVLEESVLNFAEKHVTNGAEFSKQVELALSTVDDPFVRALANFGASKVCLSCAKLLIP